MKTTLRIAFAAAFLTLFAACGNKGDLVRPTPATAQPAADVPAEKPAADKAAGDKPVGN